MSAKTHIIQLLKMTPVFPVLRDLHALFSPTHRAIRNREKADIAYLRETFSGLLQTTFYEQKPAKTVLIMGMGSVRAIAIEAVIRKAFEKAGYQTVVMAPQDRLIVKGYCELGSDTLIFPDKYQSFSYGKGAELLGSCQDFHVLKTLDSEGVHCGKYAASTLMRKTRAGTFDITDTSMRSSLIEALDKSVQSAVMARNIIQHVSPDALVLVDRGYSPSGEFFDSCIERNIPVYTWNAAHKSNSLMLKKYTAKNRDVHPASLSEKTWNMLTAMTWTPEHWSKLLQELEHCYRSGEWYAEVGTQFNKEELPKDRLIQRLGLDPSKKIAVIFPHIFWDATFFWGEDIFENYEDWFVQTVQAACKNTHVNWVIKVHPANLVKNRRDGVEGEHSELRAIRKAVGKLPSHVKLLPADTDISTYSLFSIMDYCLTVRGTVGIEAACFGIPALTAGTGRYDRLGFTIDSDNRQEYLSLLGRIQAIEHLDEKKTELARRYAYGFLLCRPAMLQSILMKYKQNNTADLQVDLVAKTAQELAGAPDMSAIADWIKSGEEDFIQPGTLPGDFNG